MVFTFSSRCYFFPSCRDSDWTLILPTICCNDAKLKRACTLSLKRSTSAISGYIARLTRPNSEFKLFGFSCFYLQFSLSGNRNRSSNGPLVWGFIPPLVTCLRAGRNFRETDRGKKKREKGWNDPKKDGGVFSRRNRLRILLFSFLFNHFVFCGLCEVFQVQVGTSQ